MINTIDLKDRKKWFAKQGYDRLEMNMQIW